MCAVRRLANPLLDATRTPKLRAGDSGAAIAFADNAIADEENEAFDALAEGLGIDETKANALFDAVDEDSKQQGAGA
jgi:uncharacterized protein YpuA (DUF1002 family)